MLFGWRPKSIKQKRAGHKEVPIRFDYEEFTPQENETPELLVYRGTRVKNTREMITKILNKQGPGLFHLKPNVNIQFNSDFESGNLDKVYEISPNNYNLYLRADSNTRGCFQWFNFSVLNKEKVKGVQFNIMNFKKPKSLFTEGMQVKIRQINTKVQEPEQQTEKSYTKSMHQFMDQWMDGGYDITYKPMVLSKYTTDTNYEREQLFFQLSFKYDFNSEMTKNQFAITIPYTFTMLENYLQVLDQDNLEYYTRQNLCRTIAGLDVPILTITNPQISDQQKKVVVISCRVHPGESIGSFVMEGILDFLFQRNSDIFNDLKSFSKNTKKKEDMTEFLRELRNNFIFKIIPMLNVDGVVLGNNRTSVSGNDLNRKYKDADELLHPEIFALKQIVQELCDRDSRPFIYIDLHGHSQKKAFFMYSNYFAIHETQYYQIRLLPQLLANQQSELFRYHTCKFNTSKAKEKTSRSVFWKEYGIVNSYTLECSFFGYRSKNHINLPFKMSDCKKMGGLLIKQIFELGKYEDLRELQRQRFLEQRRASNNILSAQQEKDMEKNAAILNKFNILLQQIDKNEKYMATKEQKKQQNEEEQKIMQQQQQMKDANIKEQQQFLNDIDEEEVEVDPSDQIDELPPDELDLLQQQLIQHIIDDSPEKATILKKIDMGLGQISKKKSQRPQDNQCKYCKRDDGRCLMHTASKKEKDKEQIQPQSTKDVLNQTSAARRSTFRRDKSETQVWLQRKVQSTILNLSSSNTPHQKSFVNQQLKQDFNLQKIIQDSVKRQHKKIQDIAQNAPQSTPLIPLVSIKTLQPKIQFGIHFNEQMQLENAENSKVYEKQISFLIEDELEKSQSSSESSDRNR